MRGFSLIEVLIFVSILSVFFIAAISVSTVTVRNMKINEHKIIATRYAEELVEWLRSEKESDWESFSGRTATYCFNDVLSWSLAGACSPPYGLDSFFKREATFTGTVVAGVINQVSVDIVVEWQELGNTYKVPIKTVFTIYAD